MSVPALKDFFMTIWFLSSMYLVIKELSTYKFLDSLETQVFALSNVWRIIVVRES